METRTPAEEKRKVKVASSGGVAEIVAALAVLALGVLGLVGIYPQIMASIGIIVIGAAFLLAGSALAARFSSLAAMAEGGAAEFGIGMSWEFLGGIAICALGVLALIGIVPMILVPAAVIVSGGTLTFSSGVNARLNSLEAEYRAVSEFGRNTAREGGSPSSGIQILVGLGAITLGILALIGIYPLILSLVGILTVGAGQFASGSAMSFSMFQTARQRY